MRLVITAPAENDLDGIFDYIAAEDPTAAMSVHRKITAMAQRLTDFPAMGRSGWLPGTRELVVPGLPYIIIYRIERTGDTVTILAVFHGARDLTRALAKRGTKS